MYLVRLHTSAIPGGYSVSHGVAIPVKVTETWPMPHAMIDGWTRPVFVLRI